MTLAQGLTAQDRGLIQLGIEPMVGENGHSLMQATAAVIHSLVLRINPSQRSPLQIIQSILADTSSFERF
jgi:hypothetical protein